MHFSSQNLDDDGGRKWKEGRAWLYFGKNHSSLNVEWHLFSRFKSLNLKVGLGHYDCALSFSLSLYFFSIHLSLDHGRLESWIQHLTRRRGRQYGNGREIGVSIHGGIIWFSLWEDPMESGSDDPRWWKFHINFLRLLLGKEKYLSQSIEKREVFIPMPEGAYPAEIELFKATWTRPRWFAKTARRAEIKMLKPIPFPGKGENAHDCGDDAVHSMTCNAASFAEAIGEMVAHVMRNRIRNGGYGRMTWGKHPAEVELEKFKSRIQYLEITRIVDEIQVAMSAIGSDEIIQRAKEDLSRDFLAGMLEQNLIQFEQQRLDDRPATAITAKSWFYKGKS